MFPSAQDPPSAQRIFFSDTEKEALKASGWTLQISPTNKPLQKDDEKDCEDYIAVEM